MAKELSIRKQIKQDQINNLISAKAELSKAIARLGKKKEILPDNMSNIVIVEVKNGLVSICKPKGITVVLKEYDMLELIEGDVIRNDEKGEYVKTEYESEMNLEI